MLDLLLKVWCPQNHELFTHFGQQQGRGFQKMRTPTEDFEVTAILHEYKYYTPILHLPSSYLKARLPNPRSQDFTKAKASQHYSHQLTPTWQPHQSTKTKCSLMASASSLKTLLNTPTDR